MSNIKYNYSMSKWLAEKKGTKFFLAKKLKIIKILRMIENHGTKKKQPKSCFKAVGLLWMLYTQICPIMMEKLTIKIRDLALIAAD